MTLSHIDAMRQQARRLAAYLERIGRKVTLAQALDGLAASQGHRNWHVLSAALKQADGASTLVAGRADDETGCVLVLADSAPPLTEAQLRAITNDTDFYVDVAVPVNIWEIANQGDIDWLNDHVSERITGSIVGLEDIHYARYQPPNADEAAPERSQVFIRVTARWTADDVEDWGGNG